VHIASMSLNAGTYTVTVDNPTAGSTGTAKARLQKWIKLLPELTGQVNSYGECPINKENTRIQIKCVLEFTGDNEFHKLALYSSEQININP
jgi:hypothetical protein